MAEGQGQWRGSWAPQLKDMLPQEQSFQNINFLIINALD